MMRVMSAQQAAPGSPPPQQYVLLGGDGSAPVKLTEADAKRIQEETEQAPEDLEDSDLAEAMQELGIKSQPLTDEDRKALGMASTGQPAAAPAAAAPSATPPAASSMEAQLKQISDLRDKGLISPEDYDAKKKQILGI